MNGKRRLLLALLVALIAISVASVCLTYRAAERRRHNKAVQQQSVESHDALSKGVQFLKPDTNSDLRFGKSNKPTPQPTPTPTTSP